MIATPRLDRLAAEGLRFTQFYSGSTVCAPSRYVLMTGVHTGRGHIRGNGKMELRAGETTIARRLHDRGYHTAVVGKWGLGHEGSTGVPSRQGFDHFFGYLDHVHAHNFYPTFLFRDDRREPLRNVVPNEGPTGGGVATVREQYAPDLFTDDALAYLDARAKHPDQPFFLYLAYTSPHANNEAGNKGMEIPDYGDYADKPWPDPQKGTAAMITRLDRDVGRVVDRLRERRLADNTLVLFSSDNGPHREGDATPTSSTPMVRTAASSATSPTAAFVSRSSLGARDGSPPERQPTTSPASSTFTRPLWNSPPTRERLRPLRLPGNRRRRNPTNQVFPHLAESVSPPHCSVGATRNQRSRSTGSFTNAAFRKRFGRESTKRSGTPTAVNSSCMMSSAIRARRPTWRGATEVARRMANLMDATTCPVPIGPKRRVLPKARGHHQNLPLGASGPQRRRATDARSDGRSLFKTGCCLRTSTGATRISRRGF